MSSCLGCSDESPGSPEREPLLPRQNDGDDETQLQAKVREKLQTYHMVQALSKGYMPSNKQLIAHLKALLRSQLLSAQTSYNLSASGRQILQATRVWLKGLLGLLEDKNSKDQIQDFFWFLRKTSLKADVESIAGSLSKGKRNANVKAVTESLKTIASLALLNNDFRVFLADVATIARQVLRDTATAVGDASTGSDSQDGSSRTGIEALKATDSKKQPPTSSKDTKEEALKLTEGFRDGAGKVAEETKSSVRSHTDDEAQKILINRLKQAVTTLRQRSDYSESVSTIGNLVKQCLHAYTTAGMESIQEMEGDVQDDTARATHNFWLLVSSFGNEEHWNELSRSTQIFMKNHQGNGNLDKLADELASAAYQLLSDPEFFDNIEDKLSETRDQIDTITAESSLRQDARRVFDALERALRSVANDEDVKNFTSTSLRLGEAVLPLGDGGSQEVFADLTDTLVPLLLQAVQYIPIPRLEVFSPALDLLIENLVLESGQTVNNSSFLPHRLQLLARNNVDIYKTRVGARTSMTNLLTIKMKGLSIAANDLGYWMRLHSGILRMADEGIACFYLDEKGIDITLEVEIARDRLEELVTVRQVHARIHHLNYSLRKSKFACIAWFLKPFLRPILKHALESKICEAMRFGIQNLNRELVFARERLRATRVCNPNDLVTFVRAVTSRLAPEADSDTDTRVGVKPGGGVFKDRYAPGSLVKVAQEEAADAERNIAESQQGGWRNEIFDVAHVPAMENDR